jgi:hypothetical protein
VVPAGWNLLEPAVPAARLDRIYGVAVREGSVPEAWRLVTPAGVLAEGKVSQ